MKSSKIKHLLCFTVIFLLFCVGNADAKNPLPEFFGVYALYNGKLVELQSHPQSQYAISGMTVMGADVLSQLSGITFPEGTIEFIVFRKDATDYSKIPLVKISRIAWQHNTGWGGSGKREKLQNSFHLTNKNIVMNVAPITQGKNMNMMVRVVPKNKIAPGIWAIKLGGDLFDFVVGSKASAECEIRKVGAAGVEYIPCNKSQRTNDLSKGNDRSNQRDLRKLNRIDNSKKQVIKLAKKGGSNLSFEQLLDNVKDKNRFNKHSHRFNSNYGVVWDAVKHNLKDEQIIESDKNTGIIITKLTRHGFFGAPKYDKYYILMEKIDGKMTEISFKLFTYSRNMEVRNKVILRPMSNRSVNKKANKFIKKVSNTIEKGL